MMQKRVRKIKNIFPEKYKERDVNSLNIIFQHFLVLLKSIFSIYYIKQTRGRETRSFSLEVFGMVACITSRLARTEDA